MKYIPASPIDLAIGDRVLANGALVEVAHITEAPCTIPGGIRVAACISRLIGDDCGAIPRAWFDTPQAMTARGCKFSAELPDGLYWNIQGNAHARVAKVLA